MSCCGQKRAQIRQTAQMQKNSRVEEKGGVFSKAENISKVYFQYMGKTALTIVGPKTWNRYRFSKPGAIIPVDTRDKRALEDVPLLRPVKRMTRPKTKTGAA